MKVESNDHYNLILYIFHAIYIFKFITKLIALLQR